MWAPVIAYMAFIFALSSISHPPAMPGGSDKWLHGLLYAGLGALFARAVAGGWRGTSLLHVLSTMCFSAMYGISDEVHQYFNPPRNVEAPSFDRANNDRSAHVVRENPSFRIESDCRMCR